MGTMMPNPSMSTKTTATTVASARRGDSTSPGTSGAVIPVAHPAAGGFRHLPTHTVLLAIGTSVAVLPCGAASRPFGCPARARCFAGQSHDGGARRHVGALLPLLLRGERCSDCGGQPEGTAGNGRPFHAWALCSTMNMLVDGEWRTDAYETTDEDGAFDRQETAFRDWVEADPDAEFPAEAGRYHLYVSYACPWAHRTLITRALKGLEDAVSVSVVDPYREDEGWEFSPEREDCTADAVAGAGYLRERYQTAAPEFTGRVT